MQLGDIELHWAAHTDKEGVDIRITSFSEYVQLCNESLYLPLSLIADVVKIMIHVNVA